MGKLYQGINGAFSGKVGPVVGYVWRGRPCIRAYSHKVHYLNTPGQQQQRSWFVSMVRFASCATQALRYGLRDSAMQWGMTEGNYFVMRNKQCFSRDKQAVEVDYEHLVLAEGPAADVYFRAPKFEQHEVVSVDFEKNMMFSRASNSDLVYLYVYAPGRAEGLMSAPALRRSKCIKMALPEEWAGEVVHLYGFVVDGGGHASNSTYIGEGKVNHYEERGVYIPINDSWREFVDIATSTYGDTPQPSATADGEARQPAATAAEGEPPKVPWRVKRE